MKQPATEVVMPHDERPARRDGTCFYCHAPIGGTHKEGCVIRQRTVVVRVALDVVISVPADWDKKMVEFARNEGSWCSDNMLRELGEWANNREVNNGHCTCGNMEVMYLRDATVKDHEMLPDLAVVEDRSKRCE